MHHTIGDVSLPLLGTRERLFWHRSLGSAHQRVLSFLLLLLYVWNTLNVTEGKPEIQSENVFISGPLVSSTVNLRKQLLSSGLVDNSR